MLALLVVLLVAVLAQPLAADVRTARVLAREDTRQSARDFLTSRFPPGTHVVIEPAVPRNWYRGRFELGYRLRGRKHTGPELRSVLRRPGWYVTALHPTARRRPPRNGELHNRHHEHNRRPR